MFGTNNTRMDFPRSRKDLIYLLTHPLALSSLLVFGSTMAGNLFAYFFNLLAFSLLKEVNYGIFAALMAIISETAVVSQSLSTTVTKFVATYRGADEADKVSGLVWGISRFFFMVGLVIFFLFVVGRTFLARFFNVPDPSSIVLIGVMIAISFLQTINLGALAGLQKFPFLALVGFLGSFLKFIFGLGLLWLGFRVNGAIGGVVLAAALVYFLTFWPLSKIFLGSRQVFLEKKKLFFYSLPAAFSLWGLAALTNNDVILVKKFFDPTTAGVYSFAALVGRVIFFASSSIAAVMFPMVSERHAAGKRYRPLFYYSLLFIFLISLGLDAFYFAFPHLTLGIFAFFRSGLYLSGSVWVGYLGLYYLMFSLCNSLVLYFLSIHKTLAAAVLPSVSALVQVFLLTSFHQSIFQMIGFSLLNVFLLLLSLLVYFVINGRR